MKIVKNSNVSKTVPCIKVNSFFMNKLRYIITWIIWHWFPKSADEIFEMGKTLGEGKWWNLR